MIIRLPQVRSCEADVFNMVAHGHLESLKIAFTERTASIYDVEDTGGHTLLHVRPDFTFLTAVADMK